MTNLIGISGKIGSGRNTIGKIIQALDWYYNAHEENIRGIYSDIEFVERVLSNKLIQHSGWQIKKFEDELEDVVFADFDEGWRNELDDYDDPDDWWYSPESINGLEDYNINDWIILDVNYPSQIQAIKDRGGILIKIERDLYDYCGFVGTKNQVNDEIYKATGKYPLKKYLNTLKVMNNISETVLDGYQDWDYVVDNNTSIEKLMKQIKNILNKEDLI